MRDWPLTRDHCNGRLTCDERPLQWETGLWWETTAMRVWLLTWDHCCNERLASDKRPLQWDWPVMRDHCNERLTCDKRPFSINMIQYFYIFVPSIKTTSHIRPLCMIPWGSLLSQVSLFILVFWLYLWLALKYKNFYLIFKFILHSKKKEL